MKVVLFGGSGMVGSGALLECLDDPRVTSVLSLVRNPSGLTHAKLREVRHQDFYDYTGFEQELAATDACFFCLGTTSNGKSEAEYRKQTVDLTVAAARAVLADSPGLTFCFVSGQGTDSSARGSVMWARVKGEAENALLAMSFKAVYIFRPGIIRPLRGVRSKTRLYQFFYGLLGPVLPLVQRLFPKQITTTSAIGRAMINVSATGYPKRVLETVDINLAGDGGSS